MKCMRLTQNKSLFRRSFLAWQCIIRRKAALIRASRGTGDISHGKWFATIAAGHFARLERGAVASRAGEEIGISNENFEFEPSTGFIGRLDARRPSGHRVAVLDLRAESGRTSDDAVGPGEI